MIKVPKSFGAAIPEVKEFITKYGCTLSDKPPFVLVGQYNSKEIGLVMGILAAANNEFYAHILRKELRKNGTCDIEYSEFHPDKTTFSIEKHKAKLREKMAKAEKVIP